MDEETYKAVVHYHEETKHHLHRSAKSLGYMDWENQPNPFRYFEGLNPVALPLLKQDPEAGYMDLYMRTNNKLQPFGLKSLAAFLELSLGLSSWKAISGSKWSLRINPSSGNLHPTESHVIVPPMDHLASGIYHYNSFNHALEPRAEVPRDLWDRIFHHFKAEGFLVALSSIFWRESWKYGERAFRYCNHDVGHALACLSFSANLQGWRLTYLNGLSDEEIETLLGFDKTQWRELEQEEPELMCFVCAGHQKEVPRSLPHDIVSAFSELSFTGMPNALSQRGVNWKIIYETAEMTRKPKTPEKTYDYGHRAFLEGTPCSLSAPEIIRQRRSGVAYNIKGSIGKEQFMAMLDKAIPRNNCAPFDVELIEPCVNLLVFLHNVRGVDQGLYFFFRTDKDADEIKGMTKSQFLWEKLETGFPLFLLKRGDFRREAALFSCRQEIAGLSALSVGMVAGFKHTIEKEPYRYRHLHWEAGMIGQILYLEAEAHAARGTGIGCFFDDAVHDLLGLQDNTYQSLYHFTVGEPVEDTKLTTYPPYFHLDVPESGST